MIMTSSLSLVVVVALLSCSLVISVADSIEENKENEVIHTSRNDHDDDNISRMIMLQQRDDDVNHPPPPSFPSLPLLPLPSRSRRIPHLMRDHHHRQRQQRRLWHSYHRHNDIDHHHHHHPINQYVPENETQYDDDDDENVPNDGPQTQRQLQSSFCVVNERQLRTAINNAVSSLSTSTTRIDVCVPVLTIDGTSAIINFPGGIVINQKRILLQCNLVDNPTGCIVDAQNINRHFYITGNTIITFRGITFVNGNGYGNFFNYQEGGSMYIDSFSQVIYDTCQFRYNQATNGGAMIIKGTSTVVITILSFPVNITNANNTASYNGGIIYMIEDSQLIVNGTNINTIIMTQNYANTAFQNDGGGGVIFCSTSSFMIDHVLFDRNEVFTNSLGNLDGGAIRSEYSIGTIVNTIFRYQFATYGGAMSVIGGQYQLKNVIFDTNEAQYWGGAVATKNRVNVDFDGVTFFQNFLNYTYGFGGGAVYSERTVANFRNCTFIANEGYRGSVIEGSYMSVLLSNVIARNNSASTYGSCIFGLSNVTLNYTTFEFNTVEDPVESGVIVLWQSRVQNIRSSLSNRISQSRRLHHDNRRVQTLSSIPCDFFIYNFDNIGPGGWRRSCLNIPYVPPRQSTRLLDGLFLNDSTIADTDADVIFSNEHHHVHRIVQGGATCAITSGDLRKAVAKAGSTPSRINVCSSRIKLGSATRRLLQGNMTSRQLQGIDVDGIDLTNKNIEFRCLIRQPRVPCVLDGLGVTRLFRGTNATVSFRKFKFANGYHNSQGGALNIENSNLQFTNCSFTNNTALSGGAVRVDSTKLVVDGTGTWVKNNGGTGNPIEIYSSTASLNNVTLMKSNISQYGGGVLVFDSQIDLARVIFVDPPGTATSSGNRKLATGVTIPSCDVFVQVFPGDSLANNSCLS